MYIRTDKLLRLLKQKTGREKEVWLLPSRGSACMWTSSRVDYSLVQILGVGVREEAVA